MKTNLFPSLIRCIFSLTIVLILTTTSFAQFKLAEKFQYLNYFSSSRSSNSTFTKPHVLIDNTNHYGKLEKKVSSKEVSNNNESKAFSRLTLEKRAFDLMNKKRAENGLKPVIWNENIANIARSHSQSMAVNKYFSHQGLDGLWVYDRANRNGLKGWKAISENIAYNSGYENPAEFAVERWMKSTSHRTNAMNKRWEESGIGVAIGADGRTVYFTQVFWESK